MAPVCRSVTHDQDRVTTLRGVLRFINLTNRPAFGLQFGFLLARQTIEPTAEHVLWLYGQRHIQNIVITGGGRISNSDKRSPAQFWRDWFLDKKVPECHLIICDQGRRTEDDIDFGLGLAKEKFGWPLPTFVLCASALSARRARAACQNYCGLGVTIISSGPTKEESVRGILKNATKLRAVLDQAADLADRVRDPGILREIARLRQTASE